jgi:cytochrome c oxidase cbb3-type subunit 4
VNGHSTYEALRHFADSWGLMAMFVIFAVLCLWPFRPGTRKRSDEAANSIFKDENDG